MHTFNIPLLTFFAFLVVFGILFLQIRRSSRRVIISYIVFLVISIAPLVVVLIDDVRNDYLDANIGLGLAFFYTWFMTAVAAILAIVSFVRNR